jgi:hypothetical protein
VNQARYINDSPEYSACIIGDEWIGPINVLISKVRGLVMNTTYFWLGGTGDHGTASNGDTFGSADPSNQDITTDTPTSAGLAFFDSAGLISGSFDFDASISMAGPTTTASVGAGNFPYASFGEVAAGSGAVSSNWTKNDYSADRNGGRPTSLLTQLLSTC